MKKKYIFFYSILLLLFTLNTHSSQIRSRSKSVLRSTKNNRKKIRKPTKKQKRRVGRIINNYKSIISLPISKNNTLLDKKNGIKALLATLLKNSPQINLNRERIAEAITNKQFSNQGITLDDQGNIIDTESKEIILTKNEIEKLNINEEIAKEIIKDTSEKTEDIMIKESNGELKKDEKTGNIVDKEGKIIVNREAINIAQNNKRTNIDGQSIETVYEPAIRILENNGVKTEIIKNIRAQIDSIPETVKNNLDANISGYQKTVTPFSDINLNETEIDVSNDFILDLDLKNKDKLKLIIDAMMFFQPFNDGIIDIFGILYQFDHVNFEKQDNNIVFNNTVILKQFILDDNTIYKNIRKNIEDYWMAIKEIAPVLKKTTNKETNELADIFNQQEEKGYTYSDHKINTIIKTISQEFDSLSFDEKLKRILFYIYALLIYSNLGELKNQSNKTKNDFFSIFVTQLLEKTKIIKKAKEVFKDKIFNNLINSEESFAFKNIETIFENKFTQENNNDTYLIMHNTEFHLLLLFNIIIAMTDSEIDFKNVNVNTQLKKILDTQANYSTETEEQNVIEAKEELVKYIKEKYTDNNIKIINNYLDTGDKKIKNTIQNQQNESVIYIPHFINFDETNSKKEYLNYFPLNRYINVYCIIDFLSKNNNTQNKNFINLYTPYFNTEKNQYSNQLYVKLFKSTKTFEKIEVEEEGELPEKEKGIARRLEHTYSNALALEYIDEIEKFKNYNNENEHILELIHVIINTINLDYFFKIIKNPIISLKETEGKEKLKTLCNYLETANNLFLKYLEAIYKTIRIKRCYIKNYDENAWNKTWKDLMQASIKPAIIASIGTTAYLIGLDNLTGAAGHVINAGVDSAKWLGSIAANNPGKTIIFGSVAAVGASVYNYFRNKQQAHKDGATEMRNTLISNKIAALEELE